MEKRSILKKTRTVTQNEIKEPIEDEVKKDIEEIFELPPNKEEKIEDPSGHEVKIEEKILDIEEIPKKLTKKGKPRNTEHLKRAREKSLEVRRRKRLEKLKEKEEADRYIETLKFEKMKKKFERSDIKSDTVYETQASSMNVNNTNTLLDYDRIINGVAERMKISNNDNYFTGMQMQIREEERKKIEKEYEERDKERKKKNRRDMAINSLSSNARRNNVFERTKSLRNSYTERYKNNWY